MTRLLPYLQLVRLPNVFTAWADIVLAALLAGALPGYAVPFVLLILSSSCLYCSGMVWNDYFDIAQDEKERPFRPLPSGKIPMSTAVMFAILLMGAGIVLALLAGVRGDGFRWHSTIIAVLLAGTILLYDGALKRTWAGPLAMGTCRFFNVLLGLSIISWTEWGLVPALVVGTYIVGVTWFARTEARESNRSMLIFAALVVLASLFLALTLPAVVPVTRIAESNLPESSLVQFGQLLFPYLIVAFALFIGLPLYKAIQFPTPNRVQPAVKRMVLGLILLDAVLTVPIVGPFGLLLAVLLLPALYVGKWVYST